MNREDEDRNTESRRILDRVARESEAGGSLASRAVRRARDHLAAEDADKDDWAEYWGTRIGRGLALVFLLGLLLWLVLFLVRGG